MKAKTQSKTHRAISLDELAQAVSNLSGRELEEIELAFSPAEEKAILKRKKSGKNAKKRRGVELNELQKEFGQS